MANEPVQVVTNPQHLRGPRITTPPVGAGDDFFAGNDAGFAQHRDALVAKLDEIERIVASPKWATVNGDLAHVLVQMRSKAIAKSHRPQQSVFRPRIAPHVGTARIGEPIFAVTRASLAKIRAKVSSAPLDVPERLNRRSGELEPNPSRLRCEVSAIADLLFWRDADKREFSSAEAAEWLGQAGTGGRYLVELFPTASTTVAPDLKEAESFARRALIESLRPLSVDARATAQLGLGAGPHVSIGLLPDGSRSHLELGIGVPVGTEVAPTPASLSAPANRHQALLDVLDASTLVRSVELPPLPLPRASEGANVGSEPVEPPLRGVGAYPIVGVIDGGVSDYVRNWMVDRWGQLSPDDTDTSHGTFIAGLLIAAGVFNDYLSETLSGCLIADLDVLPEDPAGTGRSFATYYPGGIVDFFDEVEAAVKHFRAEHGVRIFNFSLNFTKPGRASHYSYAARRLDEIARTHDVVLVISAGNLSPVEQRPEWPANPADALASVIGDRHALANEPAESLFNISVAALNPPGLPGQVDLALARYSKRGPRLNGATKPDLASIGGSGSPDTSLLHGLSSWGSAGETRSAAGTSYAAPLVARALADLDSAIDGDVSRELLVALLVHYARVPDLMLHPAIRPSARSLVGFGVPAAVDDMLLRPDSEITLVVTSSVLPKERHELIFSWPQALVEGAKCRGSVSLTLVARPVLAYEHGDERVRVNIDAKLMQQQADGGFKNALQPLNSVKSGPAPQSERELLLEQQKWQVVKAFGAHLRGRGPSPVWKFQVDYLTRAGEDLPEIGVEFAAVITIADPNGVAPVFQQMRQHLGTLGVRTGDIRTSVRSRVST